jgi:hypothetical protein
MKLWKLGAIALLLLAGCATTGIRDAWPGPASPFAAAHEEASTAATPSATGRGRAPRISAITVGGKLPRSPRVPDRAAAWLTEANWACALFARDYEVFRDWPGDLCPARTSCEVPPWDRNWINPHVQT